MTGPLSDVPTASPGFDSSVGLRLYTSVGPATRGRARARCIYTPTTYKRVSCKTNT